jgi:formate dehydrogenase iron-sulfur subunit
MYDEVQKKIIKCSMCAHRNFAGDKKAQPACVEVCPTGALSFGERDAMISEAKKIAAEAKLNIYGLEENGGTSLLILTKEDPTKVGYPQVEKSGSGGGSNPLAIGGAIVGAAAVIGGAYVGLKKYGERKNEIEKNNKA